MIAHLDAVAATLVRQDWDEVNLAGLLCLAEADWPPGLAQFRIRNVVVAGPTGILAMLRLGTVLSPVQIGIIGDLLAGRSPPG